MIIGDLVQNDLLFAEHLSRKGLKCGVLRKHDQSSNNVTIVSEYHTHFKENNIITIHTTREFIKLAKKCRLIVSFTGALIFFLGKFWFLRSLIQLPPVVNITTGSDITEWVNEKSLGAVLYRQHLHSADLNWCAPYPNSLKNIFIHDVPRVVFMRYPYYLVDQVNIGCITDKNQTISFFHTSHLDWKVNDTGENRKSSKGNDRFIRAFAKAIKSGLHAQCIILDRGSDREIAKQLIRDLGVEDRFIWKPHLSRDELVDEFYKSDVIVDQFDIGGFGGIAMEAMSVGKPVMIYIDRACARLLYPDDPPILNCHSEEEIYEQIMKCADRQFLEKLGKEAREWVYKYHNWETCLDQFIFYYTLLTGHQIQDYGWEKNPYKKDGRGGD
ncbi:MAG: glycosyltransferase [Methanoregula sp.]|nr:glycosyltransferase [Methanoregula sp.]